VSSPELPPQLFAVLVSGWSDNGWLSGGHAVRMAMELCEAYGAEGLVLPSGKQVLIESYFIQLCTRRGRSFSGV
jgi:hypothetical protein